MYRRRLLFDMLRCAWRHRRLRCVFCSGSGSWSSWRQWFRWRPHLLVAFSAGFSFHDRGIPDHVIQEEKTLDLSSEVGEGWEVMLEQQDLLVLRRPRCDASGLYEYRCEGTYRDISARDFVDAQVDLDYRRKWDSNVIKLELLVEDEETDSQVVRWVSRFPYPMYPREYVYVRRRYVDEEDQSVVIASNALDQSLFPVSGNYVRVETYRSVMVVRAHSKFDEKGLDYVLTYYDNPESNIPTYAYNWMINYGGPYFLTQVHTAAKELERMRSEAEEIVLETAHDEAGITEEVEEANIEDVKDEAQLQCESPNAASSRSITSAWRLFVQEAKWSETPELLRLVD